MVMLPHRRRAFRGGSGSPDNGFLVESFNGVTPTSHSFDIASKNIGGVAFDPTGAYCLMGIYSSASSGKRR